MNQTKIVTITYSRQGGKTSVFLLQKLREKGFFCEGYLFGKYQQEGLIPFQQARDIVGHCFKEGAGLIFVCAAGIAVRQISSFIQSKQTDSPVLVMDEMGKYVIPILSGHMGGANELAGICAGLVGALPVITTATDLHGRFAVDVFAVKNHLVMDNMKLAKLVSANILESKAVPVYLEECFTEGDTDGSEMGLHFVSGDAKKQEVGETDSVFGGIQKHAANDEKTWGIIISPYRQQSGTGMLHLIPRQVVLGVGCRKGIPVEAVEKAVFSVLEEFLVDRRAVCRLCTIDIKKDEPGLTEFCRRNKIAMHVFSQKELAAQKGEFTGSSFVSEITGVDNVCERSAMAGGGEHLIIRKQKRDGVTVAAAVFQVGLDFKAGMGFCFD